LGDESISLTRGHIQEVKVIKSRYKEQASGYIASTHLLISRLGHVTVLLRTAVHDDVIRWRRPSNGCRDDDAAVPAATWRRLTTLVVVVVGDVCVVVV